MGHSDCHFDLMVIGERMQNDTFPGRSTDRKQVHLSSMTWLGNHVRDGVASGTAAEVQRVLAAVCKRFILKVQTISFGYRRTEILRSSVVETVACQHREMSDLAELHPGGRADANSDRLDDAAVVTQIRSTTGAFLYLAQHRDDIKFDTKECAGSMQKLSTANIARVQEIVQYLAASDDFLRSIIPDQLHMWCEEGWAGDHVKRKSKSCIPMQHCGAFRRGGCTQVVAATRRPESELYALCLAVEG